MRRLDTPGSSGILGRRWSVRTELMIGATIRKQRRECASVVRAMIG
jgi:hypothetical protein